MKLSAVIITFNEEKNIERCLKSLQGIADEILVIDSYSTDKTEEICRKFDVKFIQHRFEGHIEQKNYALSLASNDYVLSLDADEALSEELFQSINAIKSQNTPADAYSFNRLTNYCGKWIKHSGWYPDVKIRLWQKKSGCWGGTNPHDKVIMQPNTKIIHLKGDLLHFSYYSISDHIKQIERFTTIGAIQEKQKGRQISFCSVIMKSKWKFVRDYVFKLGFLDGKAGYQVCKLSSWATYIKYAKLRELNQ